MSPARLAVAPMAALALCVAAVLVTAVHPVPRPTRPGPLTARTVRPFLRYVAGLVVGGYLALLGIVAVFHGVVVGEPGALADAGPAGLFLGAIAVPVFLTLYVGGGPLPASAMKRRC